MQLCRCKCNYWTCSVQVEVDIFPHDRLCKVCECGFSCHLQLEARLDLSLHPFDGVTFVSPSYTLSSTAGLPLFLTARLSKRKERKKKTALFALWHMLWKHHNPDVRQTVYDSSRHTGSITKAGLILKCLVVHACGSCFHETELVSISCCLSHVSWVYFTWRALAQIK